VTNSGGKSIAFELRVTGENKGVLRRLPRDGEEETTILMARAR